MGETRYEYALLRCADVEPRNGISDALTLEKQHQEAKKSLRPHSAIDKICGRVYTYSSRIRLHPLQKPQEERDENQTRKVQLLHERYPAAAGTGLPLPAAGASNPQDATNAVESPNGPAEAIPEPDQVETRTKLGLVTDHNPQRSFYPGPMTFRCHRPFYISEALNA